MFTAFFQYVSGGKWYPYRMDYQTQAEADAAEAWLVDNGFWHRQPDDPTVFTEPKRIATLDTPSKEI